MKSPDEDRDTSHRPDVEEGSEGPDGKDVAEALYGGVPGSSDDENTNRDDSE